MFVPITSEVTIGKGSVVKEIATGQLFEVGARLSNHEEIWGDDDWELTELTPDNRQRTVLAVKFEDLVRKFFAEVE